MGKERPNILSIAGFDPSGGAGILADVKTFESHKTLGMAVCTSLTVQNDVAFEKANWVAIEDIKAQLVTLGARFRFKVAKIGLVESFDVLQQIVAILREHNPQIKIVCDPVLKASAGFVFHSEVAKQQLEALLPHLFLLTPNWEEVQQLSGVKDAKAGAHYLSQFCHVYLKGGHNTEALGKDFLFSQQQKVYAFNPKRTNVAGKHGSGCVFSSALAAHIALQYPLHKACVRSKDYVTRFLASNQTRLGFHK
ncbi:hydroxymethylpyrimidine/phosphomethylpyrimidine kinase [Microscilla marina]|uniref:hydroxymethylpyrimidine kinase n=1 Tax=Microscilla marina ATCC 23134 TaxID=313606 RepID=A1ZKW7_MICM2|nr:hydroxymethylpyrimidine/phosphomethylpyrimidine kinase [Microscilla marina]EAY28933.1 hydroxymethylpyrimidine/phosphomethylpyrimidine kinase [Microscilla marina ATCC 23134]